MLDFNGWYLTLPTGQKQGAPDRVFPPALRTLRNAYFRVEGDDYVEFTAPTQGVRTKNTKFCRSELRELESADGKLAAWQMGDGRRHVMTVTQSVQKLPQNTPRVVVAQIHDGKDEVVAVRLTRSLMEVVHDSTTFGTLTDAYRAGDKYELTVEVSPSGDVVVIMNGRRVACRGVAPRKTCFFKTGAYVQSNETTKNAVATVRLYRATVQHAPGSRGPQTPPACDESII